MPGLQFFPEDLSEVFDGTGSLIWIFQIGASKVFRWLAVLQLMNLLVDSLNASVKSRTSKKSLDQLALCNVS